jgi:hypothetical protein
MTDFSAHKIAPGDADYVAKYNALLDELNSSVNAIKGQIGSTKVYEPDVHLFTENQAVKRAVGELSVERATDATYFDKYGVLRTAAIDEIRLNEKGVLIESSSQNIMLYSNKMNTPVTLVGTLTNNVGTLQNGDNYHQVDFTANVQSRLYETTTEQMAAAGAGTYTVSIMMWCASGTDTVRLAGFDDNSYIISDDITIDSTPRFYSFTFETTRTGSQYVAIYNSSDGLARTIFWCNVNLEKQPFATSYKATLSSTSTRYVDNINLPALNNIPASTQPQSIAVYVEKYGFYDAEIIWAAGETFDDFRMYFSVSSGVVSVRFQASGIFVIKSLGVISEFKGLLIGTFDGSKIDFYVGDEHIGSAAVSKTNSNVLKRPIDFGQQRGTYHAKSIHLKDFRIWDGYVLSESDRALLLAEYS